MTISFVGAASAAADSVTLPTHQAGDLLIVATANISSQINPPAGWNRLHVRYASDGGGRSLTVAYKIATTASEVSGTWSNALSIICVAYRDSDNYITLGGMRFTGLSQTLGTTLSWPALPANGDTAGIITPNQWVVAFAMTNVNTTNIEVAPSGYTNRASQAGSTNSKLTAHDTNAAVAAASGVAQTYSPGSSNLGAIAAIHDLGIAKSSGGGFRPVNIRGGADQ